MSFTIDEPLENGISVESFERIHEAIKGRKGSLKMPSDTFPQRHAGERLALFNSLLEVFRNNYTIGSWADALDNAQSLMQEGFEFSPFCHAQVVVCGCMCASHEQIAQIMSGLMPLIHEYPMFGDLYMGLAALNLICGELDSSARLLVLASACSSPHAFFHHLDGKTEHLRSYCENMIKVTSTALIKLTTPDAISEMKERFGVAYDDSVTPLLEKINEDPSQLYSLFAEHLSLRNWFGEATASIRDNPLPTAPALNPSPLESLPGKAFKLVLEHLPLTSLLTLRATNRDIKDSVNFRAPWSTFTEHIVGPIDPTKAVVSDSQLEAVENSPWNLFLFIRSLVRLNDILCSESDVVLSQQLEADFINVWFRTPLCQMGPLTASPGIPLFEMILGIHLSNLSTVGDRFSTVAYDYFFEQSPQLLQRIVNLLAYPSQWMSSVVLGLLISIIRLPSKNRASYVAQLRHWRLPATLKLILMSISAQNSPPAYSAYALLQSEDLLADLWPHQLATDSPDIFTTERLWWLVMAPVDAGLPSQPHITCCKLTFKEDLEGNSVISGMTFGSDSKKETRIMSAKTNQSTQSFEFSLPMAHGTCEFAGLNTLSLGSASGICTTHGNNSNNMSLGAFFIFADARPLTPELWTLAKNTVLSAPKSKEHFDAALDEQREVHYREMRAILLIAQYSSQYSLNSVNFFTMAAPDVVRLSEMPVDPRISVTLTQHRHETQGEFKYRIKCYSAATNGVHYHRAYCCTSFASELDRDIAVIKEAIQKTYPTLPSQLIKDGLGLDNPSQQLEGMIQSLINEDITELSTRLSVREESWALRRPAYSEAAGAILEAILRSGAPANASSSSTIPESSIYTVYKKWSHRLLLPHPKVQMATSSFNFEYLLFLLLDARALTQQIAANEASKPATTADLSFEAHATKKKKGMSSETVTIIALVAVMVTSVAVGVGAFFIGKRLGRE